jgi:hypothetical protein
MRTTPDANKSADKTLEKGRTKLAIDPRTFTSRALSAQGRVGCRITTRKRPRPDVDNAGEETEVLNDADVMVRGCDERLANLWLDFNGDQFLVVTLDCLVLIAQKGELDRAK